MPQRKNTITTNYEMDEYVEDVLEKPFVREKIEEYVASEIIDTWDEDHSDKIQTRSHVLHTYKMNMENAIKKAKKWKYHKNKKQ